MFNSDDYDYDNDYDYDYDDDYDDDDDDDDDVTEKYYQSEFLLNFDSVLFI